MTNKKSDEYFTHSYLCEEKITNLLNDSLTDDDKKGINLYTAKLARSLAYRLQEDLYSHVAALYLLETDEARLAVRTAFACEAARLMRYVALSLVLTFEQHVTNEHTFSALSKERISIFL